MQTDNTILLVDDHPLIRTGMRNIIHTKTSFHVVAEADNGLSAITLARIHEPAITVIDLALPDMSGIDVIEKLQSARIETCFVIMTLYNDIALLNRAISLGVCGYLMKSDGCEILVNCLERINLGELFLSPGVSVNQPIQPALPTDQAIQLKLLSWRELSVMELIAENFTSREIATKLGLSARTIQNHRARIVKKLQLSGNNSLFKFALENRQPILALNR